MISRFINLFKKNDQDEQREFQRRVHEILGDLYPDRGFTIADDTLAIGLDDSELGLTNLRSNFFLTDQTDSDLVRLVEEHIGNVFNAPAAQFATELSWDKARPDLMLQLVPSEFATKHELVSFPMAADIEIGFVVDAEKTYRYLTKSDVDRWGVDEDKIFALAEENLIDRSSDINATGVPGPNGIFVINTMDGFDAARVILPAIQNYCGEIIGTPFYFGIPNRDFLICWSKKGDREFQSGIRSQVASDFESRPYPLSPDTFEVTEMGRIKHVKPDSNDPRAAKADTN